MDTGENHFLIPLLHKPFSLLYNLQRSAASDSASGIGNDTVAAKLITPILNLDKCSGMVSDFADIEPFIFPGLPNIQNITSLYSVLLLKIILQYLDQFNLFIIPNHQIHRRIVFQAFFCRLNVTAYSHYHRRRIFLFCLVKHLPGFPICNVCDRTGIDDIDICFLLKRDNLIPCLFQPLLHSLRLISIYFTA